MQERIGREVTVKTVTGERMTGALVAFYARQIPVDHPDLPGVPIGTTDGPLVEVVIRIGQLPSGAARGEVEETPWLYHIPATAIAWLTYRESEPEPDPGPAEDITTNAEMGPSTVDSPV